jgi:hypothetical protein
MTQYASRFDEWVTPWASMPKAPLFASSAPAPKGMVKVQANEPLTPKKAPLHQSSEDPVTSATTITPAPTTNVTAVADSESETVDVKTLAIVAISISCILLLALLIFWIKSNRRDAQKALISSNLREIQKLQGSEYVPGNALDQLTGLVANTEKQVDNVNYVLKAILVNSPWLQQYLNFNNPAVLKAFGSFSVV